MAKAVENGNKETQQHITMQIPSFPRDLLQKFISSSSNHLNSRTPKTKEKEKGEDQDDNEKDEEEQEQGGGGGEEEIELSLGLSLNGRFGVDPRAKNNMLTRSSSIPEFITTTTTTSTDSNKESFNLLPVNGVSGLSRTCSLPTETEEEWRRRKELQSLRRMEAKRKRSEKQRTFRALKEKHKVEEKVLEDHSYNKREEGSIGSSGSGSSGLSELENRHSIQGTNKSSETRSPSSIQSLPENPGKFAGASAENQTCKETTTVTRQEGKDAVRNILEDMPCVSTKGDGPNGRRIEGFLYRFRKGEEVRIVCVCHGSFLSPAEFVKHAGGGDVAHPLKHIVVNPSPFL